MIKKKKEIKSGFVDILKDKFIDITNDYFLEKFENSKKDFLIYTQNNIKIKIKKELKKIIFKFIFYFLILIGALFLSFGLINVLVYFLKLPVFFTSIFYGLFLFLIAFIFYLLN